MFTNTPGIVLRETNYKDADKILTVLTRDLGKRTVKARACRRKSSKLTAAAQLLVYSDLTLYERQERYHMNEAVTLEQFWGIRQDFERLSLASYFAEVTEAVTQEGMIQPELLSLLLNALFVLDKQPQKPLELVKAAFELRLLCLIGYEPLLQSCAVCGKEEPPEPRLNLSGGVLHCAQCRADVTGGISMPLTLGALEAMRYIAWGDPKRLFSFTLSAEALTRLGDTSEAFLLTQLERGFRTLDYYKQIKNG